MHCNISQNEEEKVPNEHSIPGCADGREDEHNVENEVIKVKKKRLPVEAFY